MKLKFKNQEFQTEAVNAACDLFAGQEKNRTTFSIVEETQINLLNEFGIGNALLLNDDTILSNMQSVQKRHNLPLTDDLEGRNFCIEMETGTGKSYCFTKTIFELNKRYGFTKFIIVVPSVAIREGVYKSFEITKEHFSIAYDGVPFRYFIYNSAKLSDVRQFATSANIEVMIINIDAFKKAENVINQEQDKLNGESAMRYIQDTHSIVIIDEPQSVDNTPKAKEAIASLNPLCVLRYSATHKEKINTLYRLTPVDAYQMGLVKQICVSSNTVEHDFNKPYIRLLSVKKENGFSAKVEIDVRGKDGKITRKTFTVKNNSDLFQMSGEREFYENYIVDNIDCTPGKECLEFTNQEVVPLGKAIGSIDENLLKRAQIRRTIETHLDKELRYMDKGIKVLSLFFIDEVKKYRTEDGGKGIYAEMFEECYNELLAHDKYMPLREKFQTAVDKAHDGYFSQDKKGNYKNTKGDTQDDYSTYNTIMKDKEWLLSFDCPLRFIWSHSALREGWDNPNVFQVCTLIEQKSTFTCRQKVGRGLRLCVNQEGERIEDKDINLLHVMANESFAEFADTLQKEIEQETGVKFGVLQISLFSGMSYTEKKTVEKTVTAEQATKAVEVLKTVGIISAAGSIKPDVKPTEIELPPELDEIKPVVTAMIEQATSEKTNAIVPEKITGAAYTVTTTEEKVLTYEQAADLMEHLEDKKYVTKSGNMTKTMTDDMEKGKLDLPARYEAIRERFYEIANRANKKPPLRDASRDVIVRLKKQVVEMDPEFKAIWDKIEQKTTYRVQIDSEELVRRTVKGLKEMPNLPKARIVSQTADIDIQNMGITHRERDVRTQDVESHYAVLPDILAVICEETHVPEKMIVEIIVKSGRIGEFTNNPQLFIENFIEILNENRYALAIDGIKYIKLAGEKYYALHVFDSKELLANLDKNAIAVKNSVYDYIIYDSDTVEKPFAVALDNDPEVKMFFKLPSRFKIETPIGTYNPDWGVYLERDGTEKLYFVLETKGSTSLLDLRTKEQLKIHCGKRHFEALGDDIELRVATNWKDLKVKI